MQRQVLGVSDSGYQRESLLKTLTTRLQKYLLYKSTAVPGISAKASVEVFTLL